METLQIMIEWMKVNPWVTTAIVVYVIANLAPRPDPKTLTGGHKVLWQIIDRLCLLTADKLPGTLKMLLLDSPAKKAAKKAPKRAPKKAKPEPEPEPDAPEVELEDENKDESDEEAEPESGDDDKGAPT